MKKLSAVLEPAIKSLACPMRISWLVLIVLLGGCYGPFELTKKIYRWNMESVEGKWAREGVFLGLAVIPVYGLTLLADAMVFNSIEFWTGSNPMAVRAPKILKEGKYKALLRYDPQTQGLRIDQFDKERLVATLTFEPQPGGAMLARRGHQILLRATTEKDWIVLSDASGKEWRRHHVSEIKSLEKF